MLERFDKYWIGIVLGLLMPAIFCCLYIESMGLWYAFQTFQFQYGSLLNKMLLVSVFPDLAFIYVFYTLNTWNISKGILIGAMPYILATIWFSI